MQPKIVIDGYELGIQEDITLPIRNGFAFGAGIDIQKEPGILQVSQRLNAMTEAATTNNITDNVRWMVKYSVLGKVFGLGQGRIYAYDLGQANKWSLVHVDSNTCHSQGMAEFNGDLFWSSNGNLGRMTADALAEDLDDSENAIDLVDSTKFGATGSIIIIDATNGNEVVTYTGNAVNTLTGCTRGAYGSTAVIHSSGAVIYGFSDSYKTIDNDSDWHPMVVLGDYLTIGAGKYVATLDSAGTLTAQAVNLPIGYKIRCSSVYGKKLYLGTWKGSNIYEQPEAKVFSCSLTQLLSGEFTEEVSLKECGIHAMTVWKNTLIIFAGIGGNIYVFDGAAVRNLKIIPKIETNIGDWGEVYPGAIIEYNGNLLFGLTSGTSDYAGIYIIDKNLALTSTHILSTGNTTNLLINSLVQVGTNSFYVSYRDVSASSYAIDEISITRRITSAAYYESQIYDIANEDSVSEINGIELIAKPLASGNSVTISYKLDNASSWTSWGTITSTNQSVPLWVAIGSAKTIQIKLAFTCNNTSNDSPSILEVKIY